MYLGGDNRIRQITTDGIINRIAGTGSFGINPLTPTPALNALVRPHALAVAPDGSIFVAEEADNINFGAPRAVVRKIGIDGIIAPYAGSGLKDCSGAASGPNPALIALCAPASLALAPDGTLAIAQSVSLPTFLIRTSGMLQGLDKFTVVSRDGVYLHEFDDTGLHLRTLDALTGNVLAEMRHDASRRLTAIDDGQGNVLRIDYPESQKAIITAPFGQMTEVRLNADGYVESVVNPVGQAVTLTYGATGLLSSFSHPVDGTSTFTYDESGRLKNETAAGGGTQQLTPTRIAGGRRVSRVTRLARNTPLLNLIWVARG